MANNLQKLFLLQPLLHLPCLSLATVLYHIMQKLLSIRFIAGLKQKTTEKLKLIRVNEINLPEEPKVITITVTVVELTDILAAPLLGD